MTSRHIDERKVGAKLRHAPVSLNVLHVIGLLSAFDWMPGPTASQSSSGWAMGKQPAKLLDSPE